MMRQKNQGKERIYMDFINVNEAEIKNIYEINDSFYEKYNPQIRAIVTRILNYANQSRDIDDCVNTVYTELIEKLYQYNETRGSIGAFVAIVARSTALDYCRGNTRRNGELIGDENIDFLSEPIEFENKVEFQILVKNIKKRAERTGNYFIYYAVYILLHAGRNRKSF